MQYTTFGQTGLSVSRTGFGCIPIQRIPFGESTRILQYAYENGVTLYDTANAYTTSEERIGIALGHVRRHIVLCTKTFAGTVESVTANIDNSLRMMKTDYIDVLQIHNPSPVPRPGGEDGVYDCLLKAKTQGKIRHIGITAHGINNAKEAVKSGLYATLQYPFSYLSSEDELALIGLCETHNVGILAMKGLCGGLITNAKAAFAFLRQYGNVIPIWGIEKMREMEEFIALEENPPAFGEDMRHTVEADRKELSGNFCRGCGYCLPCPAEIPIPMAARITFLLNRAVREHFTTEGWRENMRRIDGCTACGHCAANCPYGIDTPALLREQQKGYFKAVT
jgi:aryl-alcohol dehydrogenase-like predicted oxidoreductase